MSCGSLVFAAAVVAVALSAAIHVAPIIAADAADNGNADLVHVGLNPNTCTTIPGPHSGVVTVHSNFKQDNAHVNVAVHDALPSQTYVVDVRCVGQIGTLIRTRKERDGHILTCRRPLRARSISTLPSHLLEAAVLVVLGDTFIAGRFSLS